MVLDGYYPPDIRVENEAEALVKSGHEVIVLSFKKPDLPSEENINGVKVVRFPPAGGFKKILDFTYFSLTFSYPSWVEILKVIVKKYDVDCIHVHDLPLVKTGLIVARKFNIPVIADLHENYPEVVKEFRRDMDMRKKIAMISTPIWRLKRLERFCVQHVDRVITVSNEEKDRYINEYNISKDKVIVIMNTINLDLFRSLEIKPLNFNDEFVISYIGGFGSFRGLDVAIRAMPEVLREISNARLLLVGKGMKNYEYYLRKLCKLLKVEGRVTFTGWIDFRLVPSYISVSDVCLIPYRKCTFTDIAISHKLFQYMAMGKPIVTSDVKATMRIVKECKCGLVFPSGNHKKLAECIIRLYEDKKLCKKLGRNGKISVEKKYNWNNESKKLVRIYDEVQK